MSKISFIYFDVGGVAIKDFSDNNKWDTMLKDMGLAQFEREAVDQIYDSRDDDLCLGKIHVDSLVPIYKEAFNPNLDPNFSMQKYFIDHFEQNPGLWPIIDQVKKDHQVGLLTDMYPGLLKGIFDSNLIPNIEWDQIVDSSVVGLRKPMKEMYQLATEKSGVNPQEILFIDNRTWNIEGAKSANWQTFLYDSKDYDKANADLAKFLKI